MGRHQCKNVFNNLKRNMTPQNLVGLQEEDLNITTEKKQKEMTFKNHFI